MSITLTPTASAALNGVLKSPNLVLKIEGVDQLYGAGLIEQTARYGDGSVYGSPSVNPRSFYYGGLSKNADQRSIITLNGTSTSIKQTLDPAKGQGSNVSTLSIALMDNGEVTELITPGVVIDDILSAKCLVYLGFQGTSWPVDYNVVFRGFVTDVTSDAGKVTLLLNGTDERERTTMYPQISPTLTGDIAATDTSVGLAQCTGILQPIVGPNGQIDTSFSAYLVVDNEIIGYGGITSGTSNGVTTYTAINLTRGQFATTPASHKSGASAKTFYRLTGNAIDLSLKLMASGNVDTTLLKSLPFDTYTITSVNTGGVEYHANSLYFAKVINENDLGLTIGDYVKVTGSSIVGNNVNGQVTDIVQGSGGCFVVLNRNLTTETTSQASAAFTSQYATLPDGCEMLPDEIDVAQFLHIQQLYLSGATLDFYLKDSIDNAKDFLEQKVYLPLSAYSIPRKAKTSIGYFSGPIPGTDIVTVDNTNVKSPQSISIKRSTNSNFFNEVVYKFDEDAVEDQYDSGYIGVSATSKDQIANCGNKTLVIEAPGIRSLLSGQLMVQDQVKRRFSRYQFGAETFTFSTLLETGYTVEVGDIILFDGTMLQLPDSKTGQKGLSPRLLEIQNREIQLKTGDLKFTALDTNFSGQGRHALISPSSELASVQSTSQFTLLNSSAVPEYYKWNKLVGAAIRVRSVDYSTMMTSVITRADSNTIYVMPFQSLPTPGMILEFGIYSNADSKKQHLVYGYMSDTAFPDQTAQYTMI